MAVNKTTKLFFLGMGLVPRAAHAVTWDQQAERLQLVSASLLDTAPVLTPTQAPYVLSGKSTVSVLPKMNATVGGKSEQPPQPPAHAVPTAEVTLNQNVLSGVTASIRGWGGYLPGAAAGATGMSAACEESLLGASVGTWFDLRGAGKAGVEVARQSSHTEVTGGITETTAKDRFDVKTNLTSVAVTYAPDLLSGSWVQVQRIARDVRTVFEIPGDGTVFRLHDQSSLTSSKAATQIAGGYEFKNHISIAAAYIHVPERVSMPRMTVGYNLPLGPKQGGAL
jgi:hypothetical protein